MRIAITCFALALTCAPQVAASAEHNGATPLRLSDSASSKNLGGFDLAPGILSEEIVVSGLRVRKFSPESRGLREAEGARFGDGTIQYFEGPAWDYQTSTRGPTFEVAALGGGMEDAPYFAHVAMNWRF
jgi:hypothetical protein